MTDQPHELPPMNDAMLDDESLSALFRDLRALATIDEVVIKSGPGRANEPGAATIDQAERLINDRSVRGVQIRYRHDGAHWYDTLMVTPLGVRLVRVRHEFD